MVWLQVLGEVWGYPSGTDDSHLLGCDDISLCVSRRLVQTSIISPYFSFSILDVAFRNLMLGKRKVKKTKYKRKFSICLLLRETYYQRIVHVPKLGCTWRRLALLTGHILFWLRIHSSHWIGGILCPSIRLEGLKMRNFPAWIRNNSCFIILAEILLIQFHVVHWI